MYGLDTGSKKANKRVPIVAPIRSRIRISVERQRLLSIDHAEMGHKAGVGKEHGVPIRLEIRLAKPSTDQLVFIAIEKRREVMLLNDARHDLRAIWIDIVI
jgi:hypothetical protein